MLIFPNIICVEKNLGLFSNYLKYSGVSKDKIIFVLGVMTRPKFPNQENEEFSNSSMINRKLTNPK